jgi:rSAM/selenodomain-associated transferase 2
VKVKEHLKLSIIIPILNEEERLEKLLPYLKEHTSNSEIFVIDCNKSIDKSKELCDKHSVNYVKSEKSGRAYQMNKGAKLSNSDVLMFLHADVLPPKTFEEKIFESIKSGTNAGFFAYEFDPSNRWLSINAKFTKKNGLFAGGGDQCQFMTRQVFDACGMYDVNYVIMEDFALIRKIQKKGYKISIIQDTATVSSRKYAKNSYLRVNLVNFIVFMAFLLGVSPITLKKMYSFSLK